MLVTMIHIIRTELVDYTIQTPLTRKHDDSVSTKVMRPLSLENLLKCFIIRASQTGHSLNSLPTIYRERSPPVPFHILKIQEITSDFHDTHHTQRPVNHTYNLHPQGATRLL